jgi:hypothetical protein
MIHIRQHFRHNKPQLPFGQSVAIWTRTKFRASVCTALNRAYSLRSKISTPSSNKQNAINITNEFDITDTIDWLLFYVPLKNISLMWRRHHCRWRAAKFRPILGAQGLWAGRDLYRATPAMTRCLGFSALIWRTAPFSRLLRHTRGCGGFNLTRILTGHNRYVMSWMLIRIILQKFKQYGM